MVELLKYSVVELSKVVLVELFELVVECANRTKALLLAALAGVPSRVVGQTFVQVGQCALRDVFGSSSVVEDTAGAVRLAQAVNCSGGSFDVTWIGSVTVEETIHVGEGTTVNVTGSSDGTSVADGASQTSQFNLDGGGVLHLSDLTLVNGRAEAGSGGGALLAADAAVTLTRCAFVNNSAEFGGAIVLARSELVAKDVTFVRNDAQFAGGAVYDSTGSQITLDNCTFLENTSEFGGAVVLHGSELVARDVNFIRSSSQISGGAIYDAGDGGGSQITLDGFVTFLNNEVAGGSGYLSGGGLYLSGTDVNVAGRLEFIGNAAEQGGAIYMEDSTVVFEGPLLFSNNSGSGDGGAVWGANSDISVAGSVVFTGNRADFSGGAMFVFSSTITFSSETEFVENAAGSQGGAIVLVGASLVPDGPLWFSKNSAASEGGAVFMTDDSLLVVDGPTATFTDNVANVGGAVFVRELSTLRLAGTGVTMSGNAAASSGGAMACEAITVLQVEGVQFVSNSCGVSGGAVSLVSAGIAETILRDGNPAIFRDCWFAENKANGTGGAMHISGGFADITGTDFHNNTAGRSGGAVLVSGTANLTHCTFRGNQAGIGPAVTNTVTLTLSSAELVSNTLTCDDDGLFLDWKNVSAYETACEACPEQCPTCTIQNPDRALLCEPVLEFTTSRTADGMLESLELEPGYWRSSSTSTYIRECYHGPACVGGSKGYCETGYEGPFCAVCADGYTTGGVRYTCAKCTGGRRDATIAVISVVLLLAVVLVVAARIMYLQSESEQTSDERGAARRGLAKIRSRLKRSTGAQTLKIILVSWQIITQFTSVASVTYPRLYQSFLAYIDVVNLDLAWMLSAGCLIDTDFYDSLLVSTIGPLAVAGLVLLSRAATLRRCHASDQERRSTNERRHASAIFWISFLVYSATSAIIFQTFACDDLDDGTSFLRVDHSVQCYTPKHKGFMWYAGVMSIVYPFGIPLYYALSLHGARNEIKSGQQAVAGSTVVLKDLWEPYQKHAYYYEVVECFRRVVLSGLVVFVLPNTAGQIATSFLLSMFFFVVYMILDPYRHRSQTWLGIIGHAAVMLSMFSGLLEKVDVDGDDSFSQEVFSVVLISAHGAMFLFLIAEAFGISLLAVQELRTPRQNGGRVGSRR